MSGKQIKFCIHVIPKDISDELCKEFNFKQDTMFSNYRDIPLINIPNTCVTKIFGNVFVAGNCLYRSISLSISGTHENHRKLRDMTATEFHLNRINFALIDEVKLMLLLNQLCWMVLLASTLGENNLI